MNIIIDKGEFEFISQYVSKKYIIGSHLYGTNNNDSDIDYLLLFKVPSEWIEFNYYPNFHQLQYKDGGIDYIFTSEQHFYSNIFSGESTINADVVLFNEDFDKIDRVKYLRTYKILRAYNGFAKRDLKFFKVKKDYSTYKHIVRGTYICDCLLENKIPLKTKIQELCSFDNFKLFNYQDYEFLNKTQREKLNLYYEKKEIENYSFLDFKIDNVSMKLYDKILKSNNIINFNYS